MKRSQNHLVGRESLVFTKFNTCAYAGVPATKVGGQDHVQLSFDCLH